MSKNEEKNNRIQQAESLVITLRDKPVLIDRDVARLYSVSTKEINQALRNNPDKFPEGYVFPLQLSETQDVVKNFDHLKSLKYSHVTPNAFTEKGLYMLATILRSPIATEVTIAIIEAFAKVRETERIIQTLGESREETAPELLKSLENNVKEVFTNKLPLKMKKSTFTLNIGVVKVAIEATWDKE